VNGASTGWHNYAAKWAPTNVTWYYDGVQVFQTTTATSSQMYLILNMGSNSATTPVPATLKVDYAVVNALP
jgi:beta-glucanase (GH16 family)